MDFGEGFGEVVGWGFGGGQGLFSGLDRDGAIAPRCTNEFLDAPTGLVLDPVITSSALHPLRRSYRVL
jgi:hypothetical protein